MFRMEKLCIQFCWKVRPIASVCCLIAHQIVCVWCGNGALNMQMVFRTNVCREKDKIAYRKLNCRNFSKSINAVNQWNCINYLSIFLYVWAIWTHEKYDYLNSGFYVVGSIVNSQFSLRNMLFVKLFHFFKRTEE